MERTDPWRIGVVVLAAGASRRFGAADKLLFEIAGVPLVVRTVGVVRGIAGSGIVPLVAVVVARETGPVAEAVREALRPGAGQVVVNSRHAEGMGTSVACGIAALCRAVPDLDGALVTPADMPGLTAALLDRLIAAFVAGGGAWPVHCRRPDGGVTSPMVWPRRLLPALAQLTGDRGARGLLAAETAIAVDVTVAEVHDVDTPEDLATVRRSSRGE